MTSKQERTREPRLIADVTVISKDQALLVKYKDVRKYDGQKGWFVPDDYIIYGEHPEDAARRILKGQLGLLIPKLALGFIESFSNPEGIWHLTFHFSAKLPTQSPIKPSKNIAEAKWFPVGKLPPKADTAHNGWTLSIVKTLLKKI